MGAVVVPIRRPRIGEIDVRQKTHTGPLPPLAQKLQEMWEESKRLEAASRDKKGGDKDGEPIATSASAS